MKIELLKDGRVVGTVTGSSAWVSSVVQDRMRLFGADSAREVEDDTPEILKTANGKSWWEGA